MLRDPICDLRGQADWLRGTNGRRLGQWLQVGADQSRFSLSHDFDMQQVPNRVQAGIANKSATGKRVRGFANSTRAKISGAALRRVRHLECVFKILIRVKRREVVYSCNVLYKKIDGRYAFISRRPAVVAPTKCPQSAHKVPAFGEVLGSHACARSSNASQLLLLFKSITFWISLLTVHPYNSKVNTHTHTPIVNLHNNDAYQALSL